MSQINLSRYNEGTSISSLRTETLNHLDLPIPDLDYQNRVLSILSNIDKIEINEKINRNFFSECRKYLVFLKKPFIGRLESTNNKLENYFGKTLDKHAKKIYITLKGIFDYIMAKKMDG